MVPVSVPFCFSVILTVWLYFVIVCFCSSYLIMGLGKIVVRDYGLSCVASYSLYM